MGMNKWISRKEEDEIPEFKSHDEACKWFKEKYGDNFMMEDSELIDGQKCYFYQLIHDRVAWEKGQKELRDNGFTNGKDFMSAAQPIQIFEDGHIHIVH